VLWCELWCELGVSCKRQEGWRSARRRVLVLAGASRGPTLPHRSICIGCSAQRMAHPGWAGHAGARQLVTNRIACCCESISGVIDASLQVLLAP